MCDCMIYPHSSFSAAGVQRRTPPSECCTNQLLECACENGNSASCSPSICSRLFSEQCPAKGHCGCRTLNLELRLFSSCLQPLLMRWQDSLPLSHLGSPIFIYLAVSDLSCSTACTIFVPQPGIEPVAFALQLRFK